MAKATRHLQGHKHCAVPRAGWSRRHKLPASGIHCWVCHTGARHALTPMGILLPGTGQGLHFRDSLLYPLCPWKLSTDQTASWPSRGFCSLAAPHPLFLGWRTWLQSRQSECRCSRLQSIFAFEMCRPQKAVAYPYTPHNSTGWACLGIFDSAACTGLST